MSEKHRRKDGYKIAKRYNVIYLRGENYETSGLENIMKQEKI